MVTNVSDIYVSRDVIFDEGIFPFSKISSSSNQPTQPNPPHDLRTLHVNNSSINLENDHMFSSVPANNLVAASGVFFCAARRIVARARIGCRLRTASICLVSSAYSNRCAWNLGSGPVSTIRQF
jgi:hypothetical protein